MKILIVDDNFDKIKNIMNALIEVDGIEEQMIHYSIEVNDAKKKLENSKFDLMILDLNMPQSVIEDAYENAGADFVDEIIGVNYYHKPTEIVVMSAFDEYGKSFEKEAVRKAFKILNYNESSNEWKEKIKAIAEYRMSTLHECKKKIFDYAIITAVEVETKAVRNLATKWEKISFEDDTNIYYEGKISDGLVEKSVVTVQLPDMGMVAATSVTTNLCVHFNVKYIIIVGIAAGIGEHNYGDIIIPYEVWNYSSGKFVEDNNGLVFKPDPKVIPLDARIAELVKQDYSDVLFQIKKNWPVSGMPELSVINAPLACGTTVVANRSIVDEHITAHFRKSGGIDMESYGVFFAARNFCKLNPVPICIKAISDFADADKNDSNQPYAAYTSANFAKHMILHIL